VVVGRGIRTPAPVRHDHQIGHSRCGPVDRIPIGAPVTEGAVFTLGWVSRDPFTDEDWHIHDVISAPREVMQMPLAVPFLSSRRILLSMTLTGGLMLLGPSVLGMSGSLSLPALPAASTSSFEASSHSHGDGRPPMLKCPRFDC